MLRNLSVAVLFLMCSAPALAVERIVTPAADFDITCGGQGVTFTADGLVADTPYYIYFEYVNSSGTYSQIGSGFEYSDNSGIVNTNITVGTLAGSTAHAGRVRICQYMGALDPPVEKAKNAGTFRGNGS